jgi:hypothetical protein
MIDGFGRMKEDEIVVCIKVTYYLGIRVRELKKCKTAFSKTTYLQLSP